MRHSDLHTPAYQATRARLVRRFGEDVTAPWWEGLAETLSLLSTRWRLTIGEPAGSGNTSLVLRCTMAGRGPAVLKLTPGAGIAEAEAEALRQWASSGRVPEVWESDTGAVLLEAVSPSHPGPEVELSEVAALIRDLHAAGDPSAATRDLRERIEFIFGLYRRRHPEARGLAEGKALALRLAAHPPRRVLLHGDLHPGNVLADPARGLIAIDPRPCSGDPAVDAVDWVFLSATSARAWRPRCSELASALDLGEDRLWAWCAAFAPLLAAGTSDAAVRAELLGLTQFVAE
ncbi:aminoglycoside phosphotransferase family protein [Saccharomonospora sp. NPDC006951]